MPTPQDHPEPGPIQIDHASPAEPAGHLTITALNPRNGIRFDPDTYPDTPLEPVYPVVCVSGRAVDFGTGWTTVRLAVGEHLIEVMDDHVYESQTANIAADTTHDIAIGLHGGRGDSRILIGSNDYAKRAAHHGFTPGHKAFGVALLFSMAAAAVVALVSPMLLTKGPIVTIAGYAAMILPGALSFAPLRRRFRRKELQTVAGGATPPIPEIIASGPDPRYPVRLLPYGSPLPQADAAIILRFGPQPAAVHQLSFRSRVNRKHVLSQFLSNGFEDWLSPPQVLINGHHIAARWGTWWIPVPQGRHRLQVRLNGFRDPRQPTPELTGSPVTATLDLDIAPNEAQVVDCHYNIVTLAAERMSRYPNSRSRWQQVLAALDQLDSVTRRSDGPKLQLLPGQTIRTDSGAHLT